jgi:hypothetical protein
MKSFLLFLQKPNPYGPKRLQHKIFKNRIRFGRDIQLLKFSAYAQSAMKSFPRMLSQRLKHFLVCSGCDKIISPYAQHRCTVHVKIVNIFPLAEHTRKFIRRMLSV